ncbi:hypothetical protein C8R42DRAFT_724490 [Lentinula raphanica]|nr:hypothetical protein C8R42DRAFT_724490 [Lentinula raphanica]
MSNLIRSFEFLTLHNSSIPPLFEPLRIQDHCLSAMDESSSEPGVPKTPRVRKKRNIAVAAGATPTQQNPSYVPEEEELQTASGSKVGSRQGKRATRPSVSQRTTRSRSSSIARSAVSQEASSSDQESEESDHETPVEPSAETIEEVFDKCLAALEDKVLQANEQVVQQMMDANAQLLADIKEAQVKAIKEAVKTSITSGFTGLTSSVKELTQSIEGLNKNQAIQAHLLNRLEARLDGKSCHRPNYKEGTSTHDEPSTSSSHL